MSNNNLIKLALGGLAAGLCLLGRAEAMSKCSKPPPQPSPEQPEDGPSHCSGGPTCASCTVPSDCSDVSQSSKPTEEALRKSKRLKAAIHQTPEEAECKKNF